MMKTLFSLLLTLAPVMAFANEDVAAPAPMHPTGQMFIFGVFIAVFYFLILRPQTKRAKAHRELMKNVQVGDEISTLGGIVGKITQVTDQVIHLQIAGDVTVTLQRSAIAQALPKGTVSFS